jgi:hypothetical protein
MSKISKFLTDLSSYEANHKEPSTASNLQMKGRTALALIAGLVLSLVVLTYCLTQVPISPRQIDLLSSVLFGIAGLAGSLRIYYLRKKRLSEKSSPPTE